MAASEVFNFFRPLNDTSDGEYATSALLCGVREIARVRFTSYSGEAEAYLTILRNGVTTRIGIEETQAWATAIVANGDSVTLEAFLRRGAHVEGILELLE